MKFNPSIIAIIGFVATLAIYTAVIGPMEKSLEKTREELSAAEKSYSAMQADIMRLSVVRDRIVQLRKDNEQRHKQWIKPMLNSYSMRAKSFLDMMAYECGLTGVEYNEGSLFFLPVPKEQLPNVRTARRTVRVKAVADYAAAISFLMRVEAELPLVTLQAFSLTPRKQGNGVTPDRQDMEMVLEWPCEGEEVR